MNYKFEFINLDNGIDLLKRKEKTLLMIEILDNHYALYEEDQKLHGEDYIEAKEKYNLKANEWEISNHGSLLIMKHTISSNIRNAIINSVYAKEYLDSIEEHFKDV
jgi:hypothetical protein